MAELTYSQWKKESEKTGYSGFYLFYGEETYLIESAVKKITAQIPGSVLPEFNLKEFDGGAELDDIEDAIVTFPVMSEKKCVTLHNFPVDQRGAKETEQLIKIIGMLPESTVLVLYNDAEAYDKKNEKWKSFLKKCEKTGTCVVCDKREKSDIEKMLIAFAKKRNCEISRNNVQMLIELCGNDLQILFQEMEKLCAYTDQGEITADTIRLVASPNMETTVFLLAKNLVAGKSEQAYQMLELLFRQNEKPIMILSVLSNTYVDMYRVKAAILSGHDERYPAEFFPYKGKEFTLSAAQRSSSSIPIEVLRKNLALLEEAETEMKNSPAERHRLILECLFAKLMKAKAGEIR